jgi:MFS transporter, DHA1 family, tetracycline resistance protein
LSEAQPANGTPGATAPAPEPRAAAFVFIFITVLLDMLALGMIMPVLPKLVVTISSAATPHAQRKSSACSVPPGR